MSSNEKYKQRSAYKCNKIHEVVHNDDDSKMMEMMIRITRTTITKLLYNDDIQPFIFLQAN